MTSFFGRLKGTTGPSGASAGSTPAKKDPNAPQPTPLEKLLTDAGPIRTDGSDKFFGFENFGSTCYCNSIIQCLYYSAPFREQVINFPSRSPSESLKRKSTALSTLTADGALQHGLSPLKTKTPFSSPQATASPRSKQPPTPSSATTQPKQEENKDSPEYKKKVALANGPVLTMDYENSKAYGMSESLFTSLKDIFEAIIAHDSRMGVVSPHKFLEILRRENEMFRTPMHQDAHEFLNLLLNEVVENVEQFSKQIEAKPLPAEETDSGTGLTEAVASVVSSIVPMMGVKGLMQSTRWVHELFEGTLTSETRCLTCENVSQRDEAFLDLSVDLEQHSSVTSCLRRFSEEEMLCERNKFHCDKCGGLQEAEKRMKIKRLPRILALHLKRFKYTEDMQRLQKLFHRVVYPYYLRLFNTTDDAEDPDRLYELYAVVVHIGGGPYHGHYVSIIKTQDRGWLLFDDEMVEPVDKRFVTKFFGEGQNAQGHPQNLATSYVLFYQETTVEAMQRELDSEGVPPAAAAAAAAEAQKEPLSSATIKVNGVLANGISHHPVPVTPLSEEGDHFASLDHAATAPAASMLTPPQPSGPFQNTLEPIQTSPTIPFLKRKKSKSEILAKKEQERLEKEEKERQKEEKERRKAEEKERKRVEEELEKQAKLKRKEMEHARKENQKRQEEEVAARYKAAGKSTLSAATGSSSNTSSRAGDDESYASNAATPQRVTGLGLLEERELPPTSHPYPILKENGSTTPSGLGGSGGGSMLHRFRNTSMSLRQKPKFWHSKDKDKEKVRHSGEHLHPSDANARREEFAVQGPGIPIPGEQLEIPHTTSTLYSPELGSKPGKEKKESRFSLGRKKSLGGLLS